MTTELVLLIALFVFITAASIFGDNGPFRVFGNSGPRLTARIEKNISTGSTFNTSDSGNASDEKWEQPPSAPPSGQL